MSIAPGAIEKPHHHCLPADFVVDRVVSVHDFNGATGEEIPLPIPRRAAADYREFLPQPLHYVENHDKRPFHATRIEIKQGFPTSSAAPCREASASMAQGHRFKSVWPSEALSGAP